METRTCPIQKSSVFISRYLITEFKLQGTFLFAFHQLLPKLLFTGNTYCPHSLHQPSVHRTSDKLSKDFSLNCNCRLHHPHKMVKKNQKQSWHSFILQIFKCLVLSDKQSKTQRFLQGYKTETSRKSSQGRCWELE